MTHLDLDRLSIALVGAAGHEHRARAIGARAAALLAERVAREAPPSRPATQRLAVAPVELDLARMSDEAVARVVADAAYAAMAGTSDA
jgi:hypothetical protein